MPLGKNIDPSIDKLLKQDPMTQREFIVWLLNRHGALATYQMFRNWNYYRIKILKYLKPCSYAGFRRAVWQMTVPDKKKKKKPLLELVNPLTKKGAFEPRDYKLVAGYEEYTEFS